ncbi:unnamed protein product, partial [Rotaria magnacalcarata]
DGDDDDEDVIVQYR